MLDRANNYIQHGFPVIPLCWPSPTGQCACGMNHQEGNIGKVPLTAHGLKDATQTLLGVKEFWGRWPKANIGVVIPDGYFVLDVDISHNGFASLEALQEKYDALPETLQITTGSGGAHFWYKTPVEIRNTARLAGYDGIDVRGKGGYVVAPPSIHRNGLPYQKSPIWNGDIMPAPEWLITLCTAKTPTVIPINTTGRIMDGARNDTLARIAGAMRRKGVSDNAIFAAISLTNQEQCVPPLPDSDVMKIAKSIGRYNPEEPPTQTPGWNGGGVI